MDQSITQCLREAVSLLDHSDKAFDAELLLAHTLKKSRAYLHAFGDEIVPSQSYQAFLTLIRKRATGMPVAYLLGQKEFWSLNFKVTQETLVPRPETEHLVELALQFFPEMTLKVADLGTGTGAIAIALASERPTWQIFATDANPHTLKIAAENATQLSAHAITFHQGDWCQALNETAFDLIISNPPYLTHDEWLSNKHELHCEPYHALVSEGDGYLALTTIISQSQSHLKKMGRLMVEHGSTQGQRVREIFSRQNYQQIQTFLDFSGQARITTGLYEE